MQSVSITIKSLDFSLRVDEQLVKIFNKELI